MGKTENRNKSRYNPKQLIEISIEQLKYSYTPYSGFKVIIGEKWKRIYGMQY